MNKITYEQRLQTYTNALSHYGEEKQLVVALEELSECQKEKVGKKDAEKAFKKVHADVQILIDAVNRQKKSSQWCKDGGQFIPHPATWLNNERWNDVLDTNMGMKVPMGASGELGAAEMEAIQRILREG